MSALSTTLQAHTKGIPSGKNVVVDEKEAAQSIATVAAKNGDITLAASHPNSDKADQFVGLAVLEAGGDFVRFAYHPRPLGDHGVEVQILYNGVCGSDLHNIDSGWGPAKYPVIPGHEIVGKVVAVGPKVTRMRCGDMVGIGTEVLTCGHCNECKSEQDAYCSKAVLTYNATYPDGQWAFGGYQNRVRVHEEWVFPLPKVLDPAEAAPLLCAGITVFAPLARAVKPGHTVGVVGIGGLGHLAVQFAAKLGATVTAISTSTRKQADAEKLGASSFLLSTDAKQMAAAWRSLDIVIVTANPDNFVLDPLLQIVKVGGHLIYVGAPETPITLNPFLLIMNKLSVDGSIVGSKKEVEACLQFAAKHGVRTWIEKLPIHKANEAVKKVTTAFTFSCCCQIFCMSCNGVVELDEEETAEVAIRAENLLWVYSSPECHAIRDTIQTAPLKFSPIDQSVRIYTI